MNRVATASPSAPRRPTRLSQTRTAPALWRYVLDQRWPTPAYLEEQEDGWREVSWQEAAERVDALAHALLARGVGRGDAVAVLARTRLEWILLDWAMMNDRRGRRRHLSDEHRDASARTSSPTRRRCSRSPRTTRSARSSRSVQDELPALREIVPFDELPRARGRGTRTMPPSTPERSTRPRARSSEDDLGTLIYTSGTTGPPKGCMLTHRNLVTAAIRVRTNLEDGSDVVLLFLPLAHTFGRLAHQAAAYYGSTVALVADATRVAEALGAVRPTILPAVPRIYEKIHAGVLDQIEGDERRQALARPLGLRRRRARKPPAARRAAGAALLRAAGARRRQARLREGEANGSAVASASASPAQRRSASTCSSSSTRSGCS